MRQGLLAVAAVLMLAGCTGYGYAYDYDPYLGVRGHYVGPFEARRAPPASCARVEYRGPIANGYGEPYDAGPYCVR